MGVLPHSLVSVGGRYTHVHVYVTSMSVLVMIHFLLYGELKDELLGNIKIPSI